MIEFFNEVIIVSFLTYEIIKSFLRELIMIRARNFQLSKEKVNLLALFDIKNFRSYIKANFSF